LFDGEFNFGASLRGLQRRVKNLRATGWEWLRRDTARWGPSFAKSAREGRHRALPLEKL
jgi:hypothetical protein